MTDTDLEYHRKVQRSKRFKSLSFSLSASCEMKFFPLIFFFSHLEFFSGQKARGKEQMIRKPSMRWGLHTCKTKKRRKVEVECMGANALIQSSASLHRTARGEAWSGAVPQQIRERVSYSRMPMLTVLPMLTCYMSPNVKKAYLNMYVPANSYQLCNYALYASLASSSLLLSSFSFSSSSSSSASLLELSSFNSVFQLLGTVLVLRNSSAWSKAAKEPALVSTAGSISLQKYFN